MIFISCPVCKKKCKNHNGLSSHLFKQKDKRHFNFIGQQEKIIKSYFKKDISPENLQKQDDIFVGSYYIRKIWKESFPYGERKNRISAASLKKQWASGKRKMGQNCTKAGYTYSLEHKDSISKKQYNLIISLFDSDFSQKDIAKRAKVNEKTIIATFKREFSKYKISKRNKRMELLRQKKSGGHNKLENKNPAKYKKIVAEFKLSKGLKTISEELRTGTGTIKRIWLERFGEKAYEKRVAKMLRLQQKRAAKSLKKARFLGSKNEILCYKLLKKALPKEKIIHHDYSIVPRLEIDISIPDRKVAICWDGLCHRKPIYGKKSFARTKKHDKIRKRCLSKINWSHIIIVDNGGHDPQFVKKQVAKILKAI
jgi:predicted DNA-binding protein YlxM (UPF0122 family)